MEQDSIIHSKHFNNRKADDPYWLFLLANTRKGVPIIPSNQYTRAVYIHPADIAISGDVISFIKYARAPSLTPMPQNEIGTIPLSIDGGVTAKECQNINLGSMEWSNIAIIDTFNNQQVKQLKNANMVSAKFFDK